MSGTPNMTPEQQAEAARAAKAAEDKAAEAKAAEDTKTTKEKAPTKEPADAAQEKANAEFWKKNDKWNR